MEQHRWIVDVLHDIAAYAAQNQLIGVCGAVLESREIVEFALAPEPREPSDESLADILLGANRPVDTLI